MKYLSASGFESAQVDPLRIICKFNGSAVDESTPHKTVSFDWRGTKELFRSLAATRNGDLPNQTSLS